MSALKLSSSSTPSAHITQPNAETWRLQISAGQVGQYRLAQLDDYTKLSRTRFPWRPPVTLAFRARASAETIPGTWGVGLWNDPFSISFGFGGGVRRLPALPQAAWFFFASEHNYLSLQDALPAHGPLAAIFRSSRIPPALLALGAPALGLLAWSPAARLLRRLARPLIKQDAVVLSIAATEWHNYEMVWRRAGVEFRVEGETVLETQIAPQPPLGLVLWIDNQYAAFPPSGKLSFGSLATESTCWIEIKDLRISAE